MYSFRTRFTSFLTKLPKSEIDIFYNPSKIEESRSQLIQKQVNNEYSLPITIDLTNIIVSFEGTSNDLYDQHCQKIAPTNHIL